jgi:hypothetical protein
MSYLVRPKQRVCSHQELLFLLRTKGQNDDQFYAQHSNTKYKQQNGQRQGKSVKNQEKNTQ